MLPMTLQFLVVMIAAAINDRLQRKLDYTQEEVSVLREQLTALTVGKRLFFTADQRRRLATAGRLLTPDERRKCCQIVNPATILAWFRHLGGQLIRKRPGPTNDNGTNGQVACRSRLGGLLNFYHREAT